MAISLFPLKWMPSLTALSIFQMGQQEVQVISPLPYLHDTNPQGKPPPAAAYLWDNCITLELWGTETFLGVFRWDQRYVTDEPWTGWILEYEQIIDFG